MSETSAAMSARLNSYPWPCPGAIVQFRKKPLARWTVHTATSILTVRTAPVISVNTPAIEEQAADKLDEAHANREWKCGSETKLGKERGGPGRAATAPEAKELLRTMRRKNHPDRQPQYGRTEQRHVPSDARGRRPAQAVYCVTLRRWKYSILGAIRSQQFGVRRSSFVVPGSLFRVQG